MFLSGTIGTALVALFWRGDPLAAAVVMSAAPVLWDVFVTGNSPSLLTGAGLLLGLTAIGLSSYAPGTDPVAASGIRLAILAGLVFGALMIMISYVSDGSGGGPIFIHGHVSYLVSIYMCFDTERV